MTSQLNKQRRNVLVLGLTLIFLEFSNHKITKLPYKLLEDIDLIEKPILGIQSYNGLLGILFTFVFLHFFSSYEEYFKANYKKSSVGKLFCDKPIDKVFSAYSNLIDFILRKEIYEIVIPSYIAMILLTSFFNSLLFQIENSAFNMLISLSITTVYFMTFPIMNLYRERKRALSKKGTKFEERISHEKKTIRGVKKNTNIIKLREMYNDRKKNRRVK